MIYRFLLQRGQYSTYVEVQQSEYEFVPRWETIKLIPVTETMSINQAAHKARDYIEDMKSLEFGKIIK